MKIIIILAIMVVAFVWYDTNINQATNTVQTETILPSQNNDIEEEVPQDIYNCDGRTYCSQMTSCKEAKFFIKNCPDTKMDGDGDGIPCERQWCH